MKNKIFVLTVLSFIVVLIILTYCAWIFGVRAGQWECIFDRITNDTGLADCICPKSAPLVFETFEVSAFTSSPEETDSNPCGTASGVDICEAYQNESFSFENKTWHGWGIVACPPGYPFGTEFWIEGVNVFVCLDRMAERYRDGNYLDIYMGEGADAKKRAKEFGRKQLKVRLLNK